MFQRLNHRLGHYLLLLAAGVCLFLINLGGPALWDIDEGRNFTAALEMLESGNWIVPTFNGQLRSHKPALLYWLVVGAFQVFGINEFAGRLPSALAALLALLLVYELGRRMFSAGTGVIAGLILASTTLFCASAHFANPDALLLAFTTATFLLFWLGIDSGRSAWFLAAGVAAGLAMLAKGPVGLVLPAGVIVLFLLWSGRWRLLFNRVWMQAFGLCCLVALPWYILVAIDTKREFLTEFLLTHNLDRALNPMENHAGPPWYYLLVLMFGLVPWSAFLGSAIWYGSVDGERRAVVNSQLNACRLRRAAGLFFPSPPVLRGEGGQNPSENLEVVPGSSPSPPTPLPRSTGGEGRLFPAARLSTRQTDAYRFLWCWIGVYLLAFTVAATKLPNYILPIFPPFALLIARFLDRWRRGELELPAWLQPASVAILALIGVTTTVGLMIAGGTIPVEMLHGRSWPGLEQWAALGAIPFAGAALAAWFLHRQQRTAFVTVTLIAALGFLAPLAAGGSEALNHFRAPRPLVEQAGALQRDQEIRIGCYQLEFLPSLNFYVQRNVQHQQHDVDVLDFLRQEHKVFVFLPRTEWELLAPRVVVPCRVLAMHREMYRAGEVVVVTNR